MGGRGAAVCRGTLVAAALVSLAAAACVSADVPESLPGPTSTTTTTTEAAPEPDCGDPAASLRPTGPATSTVPPGSTMAAIRDQGFVRVGVDTATLRLSSVDSSGEFEGFDVDIAREVARALFGDPSRISFVGIPSSDRVDALVEGRVDMVVDVFTPTCTRREQIDFSTNYYAAKQLVLVRDDDPARTVDDLADHRICASAGSTTLANIDELPAAGLEAVPAAERADCLVMLQQGLIDGLSTDDTILAGFAAQDPNLRLLEGSISEEPTAIGLPLGADDWVRYVNAVLDEVRTSGRWDQLYDVWLADLLGPSPGPPAPAYVD